MMPDPLFILAVALAAMVVGISKSGVVMGLGSINVPLLTMVMSARDAAGVLLPVMVLVDMIALYVYAREVNWRIVFIVVPGSLLGIGLGWALSASVDEAAVRLAIGVVTLLFLIDMTFPIRKKLAGVVPPSRSWGVFWGAVSGFTSFVSHNGGPPYQIYVIPQRLAPNIFAGTAAVVFAITNIAKLGPYALLGQLQPGNLAISAGMVPLSLAAMFGGVYVVRRVPATLFYRIAYLLMLVFSLKLIWDGLAHYLF
jgi:uncharacterized membrane protein YfcA